MHLFKADKNFFGGHGIVGAQVPLGTGIAFANKYLNKKAATFCFFGDGAVNQGQFMKLLIWLPMAITNYLYYENNQYGMGTSVERSQ